MRSVNSSPSLKTVIPSLIIFKHRRYMGSNSALDNDFALRGSIPILMASNKEQPMKNESLASVKPYVSA